MYVYLQSRSMQMYQFVGMSGVGVTVTGGINFGNIVIKSQIPSIMSPQMCVYGRSLHNSCHLLSRILRKEKSATHLALLTK